MIKSTTALRNLIKAGGPGIVPGATDCFVAKLIEAAGFPAVYITGGGMANTYLGTPDIGLITLNELTSQVERICDSVSVPVIADCDTGFGGVANVKRTVKNYERAGAAGLPSCATPFLTCCRSWRATKPVSPGRSPEVSNKCWRSDAL